MSGKCYRPEYDQARQYCDASQQTSVAPEYVQPHGNAAVIEAIKTQSNQQPGFQVGTAPDGSTRRPYAYAQSNGQNLDAGAGLLQTDNVQAMNANVRAGRRYGKTGERRSGVRADANMFSGRTNSNGPINAEMSVFNANAQLDAGEDGFTVGASANIVSGGVTLGNQQPSADSDMDSSLRVGAGVGPGGAVRGHYGDKDNDGVPEVGIGMDIPVVGVSFDAKSEAVGHYTNCAGDEWADAMGHSRGPNPHYTNANSAKREAARPPEWLQSLWRRF